MTGQDLCVHIPAAASVGGALLIHCIVFHKAPHLYSDGGEESIYNLGNRLDVL